ncbi:hypothetical protein BFX40_11270 [Mesorhizobium sp. SEMIA 3007]|uniref:GAP1-N1 domain-containing protein n=1 Tax=Mesorhizobium sp. SEMIA 3007 TaxID=1862350 RepID=UPI00083D91D3|nr:hypothetical protein [Mesorhizobium sp. SEMIA 3007]ODA93390.1 hypothetical protein BFX40_11270 [Mesorhizobium sp. SEMIA 3007]
MSVIERQVHGYRQGHQLLAASAQLPKDDQSVVDRLSDVAGPLRPRERFESYLTAYPLPGAQHFVLARTWQDLTVARAGCVRTLSLIIPMTDWAEAEGISAYLDLVGIDRLPDDSDATQVVVRATPAEPLPPATGFGGSELLEALFLEEARPVVVLDAVDPDLIATRLLTALWPSLRRRFAVSTFALSPRKVAGRDFDLVFAPKDARAKFADWNGRRVDGRSAQGGRHPWTRAIVSRVFDQVYPRLLSATEVELVGGGDPDIDNTAAFRIAMLWDELVAKLHTTPTAALGLLDIANSGKVRDSLALTAIEPSLASAAHQASATFPEVEAWSFLGALARKLQGRSMPMGRAAVAEAVEQLAARAPEGAVALLSQDDPRGVVADLLPKIASGIGGAFTDRAARALLEANASVLGRLLAQDGPLIGRVADDPPLVDRLGQVLPQLDAATLDVIGRSLLPLLTEDWQIPAAEPLLGRLDGPQLAIELRRLGEVNNFGAAQLSGLVLDRALSASSGAEVRSALVSLSPTTSRDAMIARTLIPSVEDARWLADSDALDQAAATTMLLDLLRQADDRQFAAMLVDKVVGERAIDRLTTRAPDLRLRAVSSDALPIATFVKILPRVLDGLPGDTKVKLAQHALSRCLGCRFGNDEVAFLASMLSIVGDQLDGAWAARIGLAKNVDAAIASRNMVAFRKATQPARLRMVLSVAEVAQVLRDRRSFDLDEEAVKACAAFMFDAEKAIPSALLEAAGYLLPTLLRSRNRPVSLMVAAVFPPIHREFAKADDLPEFFKFIPFMDWDRCKAVRHELIDAFMSSSWPPRDLALTACRANEIARIIRRVAKQHDGEAYIKLIASDVGKLPEGCRKAVENAISQVRANPSAKYDWRD